MRKKYKHIILISFLAIVIIISGIIFVKKGSPEKKNEPTNDITDATKIKSYEKPADDEIEGYWLNENNELLNISIKNQEYFIHSFTPSLVYYYEKNKVLKDIQGNESQRKDYSIIEKGDNYEIWKCKELGAPLQFCKLIENGSYYEIQTSHYGESDSWQKYGFKSLYIVKSKKLLFYSETTSNTPDTGEWNAEAGLLGTYYYFKDKKAFISQENKYSTRPPFNESVAFYKIKEVPQQ